LADESNAYPAAYFREHRLRAGVVNTGIDGSYFACVASDGVEEAKHGGAEAAALPFLRAALSFWVAHSLPCKWEVPAQFFERSQEGMFPRGDRFR
jgi:hypothetical protein